MTEKIGPTPEGLERLQSGKTFTLPLDEGFDPDRDYLIFLSQEGKSIIPIDEKTGEILEQKEALEYMKTHRSVKGYVPLAATGDTIVLEKLIYTGGGLYIDSSIIELTQDGWKSISPGMLSVIGSSVGPMSFSRF